MFNEIILKKDETWLYCYLVNTSF